MEIPFVDLRAQYLSLKTEIDQAIQQVIDNSSFIGGQAIRDFESSFAEYIGVKQCIACANGTDSLEILMKAMGIGKGDEVIVPALSWISTSESVSAVGAKPVFVDIDEFYTIDSSLITEKITSRTKAIIPVHLYGHPANMPAIMQIAGEHNLKVIEDCAQSHGATIENKITGTWGDAASFSFYPGKNLGAYGDAGAMLTNDIALAKLCRQIANHGQQKKHDHHIEGRNSRMDTIQAAILNAKLPHLNQWTEARIRIAALYNKMFKGVKITTPRSRAGAKHVYHLYVIKTEQRSGLQDHLSKKGVQTAIHYPTALPFMPCYASRKYEPKDFPVSNKIQHQILSLPIFAELTEEQVTYITEQVKAFD